MLTDVGIRRLRPKDKRYDVRDTGSYGRGTLVLRVGVSGRKVFNFVYWESGKNRRLVLGEYGEAEEGRLTLAQARQKAQELAVRLERGESLREAPEPETSEEGRAPYTVAQLAEDYLRLWAMPRKRTWRDDEENLRLDVLPVWGERLITEITRRDVVRLLDGIVQRGAPIAANRRLALIRKMFQFALSRGEIPSHPCAGLSPVSPERRKQRFLDEEELRLFLRFLWGPRGASRNMRRALLTILGTAQRPGEVCQMRREQVAGGWWNLPGELAKNGLAHRVPLSPWVQRLLATSDTQSPWFFPARGNLEACISETSLSQTLRRNFERMGLAPFTPHDLRRTAATHISRLGFGRFVVQKILNHAESGVTGVYDRYDYDAEKQEALNALGEFLEELMGETQKASTGNS